MRHIAPFTLRTLLYGNENLDLTVNKRIVTETCRFIKDSKSFDPWFAWFCNLLSSFSDCVCLPFIVNIPFVIILLMSICFSSLLVWVSIQICLNHTKPHLDLSRCPLLHKSSDTTWELRMTKPQPKHYEHFSESQPSCTSSICFRLTITPDSPVWVGAWWMGFLLSGSLAVLTSIPILAFPKYLPGTAALRAERVSEAHGGKGTSSATEHTEKCISLRAIWTSFKLLITNPTFIFLNLAGASEGKYLC